MYVHEVLSKSVVGKVQFMHGRKTVREVSTSRPFEQKIYYYK